MEENHEYFKEFNLKLQGMEEKVNELIKNPFKPHEEQLKIFSDQVNMVKDFRNTVATVKPIFGRK